MSQKTSPIPSLYNANLSSKFMKAFSQLFRPTLEVKMFLTVIFAISAVFTSYSQFSHLKETTYTAFNGSKFEVYLIEGEYTVFQFSKDLLTDAQLNDRETLHKIRDGIDGYYLGFKTLFGVEPVGGNVNYKNKANVFFGSPSCGAACGLLGAKGIEVGGNFLGSIFNETKFKTNTHALGLVGYEFGRNFFTVGNKVLFPYNVSKDERNGGFAEGFANLGQLESYISFVAPTFNEERRRFQETSFYHRQLRHLFLAYINDLSKNPYNCMLIENHIQDYNRNKWSINSPSYIASGILVGTYNLFGKPDLKNFINTILSRNQASTVEYALGSIALGFSKSINLNLNNFFEHVLKFKIDQDAKNKISQLPTIQRDRLIPDVDEFFFATPLDSIALNIRSINYNPSNTNVKYKITEGEKVISTSQDGNNILHYSILENKPNIDLKISLLIDGIEQDSYSVRLKKRHKIEYAEIIENSFLYSSNGTGIATVDGINIVIRNSTEMLSTPVKDNNIFQYSYPIVKDRVIKISGEIKNKTIIPNEGWSNLAIGGRWGSHGTSRIGLDEGKDNFQDYFKVEQTMNSTFYFFNSEEAKKMNYLEMKFWSQTANSNANFRKLQIEDITDTDKDGFIDFEDSCPTVAGLCIGCPDTQNPTVKTKSNYIIKLDIQGKATLKWEDIDEGSSDNCSIKERKLSKTEFNRVDGGDNKVTYTITDTSGNTSSINLTVRVDIVLSSPERPNQGNSIKAYPNPVNDYLYLDFAEGISSIRTSSLVDASGKELGELILEDAGNGRLGFSTRDLKTGMYFLRLGTRDTLHLIKFTVIH